MTRVNEVFLELMRAALSGEKASESLILPQGEWEKVLDLAAEQEVLPLILDACILLPSFKNLGRELCRAWQQKAVPVATRQIVQTNEFLTLVLHAQAQGLNPVVLKGIVCRDLYPKPMLRPSVDEDLLIAPEETEAYHEFFLSQGLLADEPEKDRVTADELSYHRPNSPTYIELHKSLIPPASEAYGDLNALFLGALDRAQELHVEDVKLRTLAQTDHLLYLICHAYKHFLHSGVGIRQVADMAMFANAYGESIDWLRLFDACRTVQIETFTAALFRIGQKYLTFQEIPKPFSDITVDEQPLLEDILSGGLYGNVDIDRAHSGNMTLDAVAAHKHGRQSTGFWRSLFPGSSYLKASFSYARKYPILVPVAWAHRVGKYLICNHVGNPAETIRIGQSRIALLRQYGIIKHGS